MRGESFRNMSFIEFGKKAFYCYDYSVLLTYCLKFTVWTLNVMVIPGCGRVFVLFSFNLFWRFLLVRHW